MPYTLFVNRAVLLHIVTLALCAKWGRGLLFVVSLTVSLCLPATQHQRANKEIIMPGKVGFTFRDFAKQTSRFELSTDDVTAANLAAIEAQRGALKTALNALTRGVFARETLLAVDIEDAGVSSDEEASREVKWLLRLQDSVTGEQLTRELPTALLTGHLVAGTEDANMAHADWVALKSAIDGNYINPETNNSLFLVSAKKVGRNL
jgi:hypothetical protein